MRYIEIFVVDLKTQSCAMQDDKKLVFSKQPIMIWQVNVAQRKMKQINKWFQCPVRNLNTKRRMRCFPKDVLLNKHVPLILKLAVAQHKKEETTGFKAWLRTLNTKRQLKSCSLKAADPRDNIKILQF